MEFNEKIQKLFDYISQLEGENQVLKAEIARIKGVSAKPVIAPAKPGGSNGVEQEQKKRGGSKPGAHRSKTSGLKIHQTQVIEPSAALPGGSTFKGYQEYVVMPIQG